MEIKTIFGEGSRHGGRDSGGPLAGRAAGTPLRGNPLRAVACGETLDLTARGSLTVRQEASWHLRVPMISALFHQASDPRRLEPLRLVEVLDWAGDGLARVERVTFFERFEADQAVQYFYEPFLEAFDPELRRELGVWYTPREIVRYQVARVDAALREELGVAAGLADPSVVVLDPCCGTGAHLVETLRLIHRRIQESGDGDDILPQQITRP